MIPFLFASDCIIYSKLKNQNPYAWASLRNVTEVPRYSPRSRLGLRESFPIQSKGP